MERPAVAGSRFGAAARFGCFSVRRQSGYNQLASSFRLPEKRLVNLVNYHLMLGSTSRLRYENDLMDPTQHAKGACSFEISTWASR